MGGLLCLLLGAAASPCGRWLHSASYSEALQGVYVFGGLGSHGWLGDLHFYDLVTRSWRVLVPGPPRAAHGAAATREGLVVFGGLQGAGRLDDLQLYDGEVWRELRPQGVRPSGRYLHGTAWNGKGLFVFGGWGERERQNDLHFYDQEANRWSQLHPSGSVLPRHGPALAWSPVAQGLYVFGGAGAAGELTDLLFYDPQAEHWRELRPSGRPPRPGRGAAWHGEGLVVLGGDALHFYDAQANRWTELSGAPWQALWAANGLCVFGGFSGQETAERLLEQVEQDNSFSNSTMNSTTLTTSRSSTTSSSTSSWTASSSSTSSSTTSSSTSSSTTSTSTSSSTTSSSTSSSTTSTSTSSSTTSSSSSSSTTSISTSSSTTSSSTSSSTTSSSTSSSTTSSSTSSSTTSTSTSSSTTSTSTSSSTTSTSTSTSTTSSSLSGSTTSSSTSSTSTSSSSTSTSSTSNSSTSTTSSSTTSSFSTTSFSTSSSSTSSSSTSSSTTSSTSTSSSSISSSSTSSSTTSASTSLTSTSATSTTTLPVVMCIPEESNCSSYMLHSQRCEMNCSSSGSLVGHRTCIVTAEGARYFGSSFCQTQGFTSTLRTWVLGSMRVRLRGGSLESAAQEALVAVMGIQNEQLEELTVKAAPFRRLSEGGGAYTVDYLIEEWSLEEAQKRTGATWSPTAAELLRVAYAMIKEDSLEQTQFIRLLQSRQVQVLDVASTGVAPAMMVTTEMVVPNDLLEEEEAGMHGVGIALSGLVLLLLVVIVAVRCLRRSKEPVAEDEEEPRDERRKITVMLPNLTVLGSLDVPDERFANRSSLRLEEDDFEATLVLPERSASWRLPGSDEACRVELCEALPLEREGSDVPSERSAGSLRVPQALEDFRVNLCEALPLDRV